jgi:NTE family protein
MKHLLCITAVCLLSLTAAAQSAPQSTAVTPSAAAAQSTSKRLLVISGGGARGAWGVGVIAELIRLHGGYKAVFGTSTGSLMAPLILLKDIDTLEQAYSNVTQNSIFSKNPFNVTYDANTGTVTTSLKKFNAIWRFIWGYRTFGETKNLLKLIQQFLTPTRYDSLLQGFHDTQLALAVAVTNTRTGKLEMIYDTSFKKGQYNELCRWIWASANEPLYMSYVKMGDAYYVDGGVREVIPIQEGLNYAIDHDIDSVDVVINNARVPINQNWNADSSGILSGLERLLDIYGLGIVQYNESYARLLANYFDQVGSLPNRSANPTPIPPDSAKQYIHLKMYWMPDSLAQKYQDALGFVKAPMQYLIAQGHLYGADTSEHYFKLDVQKAAIRKNAGLLTDKKQ